MRPGFLATAVSFSCAVAICFPALAADLPARTSAIPPSPLIPVPVTQWTGLYFGASVGAALGRSTSSNIPGAGAGNAFDDGLIPAAVSTSPTGLASGVQLGFNYQFGAAVLGAEAELAGLGLRQSKFIVNSPPDNAASVVYQGFGALTARAGYTFGNTLLYVKGGLAVARIRNGAADLINGTAVIDASDLSVRRSLRTGWALGGGVEHMLTNNFSLRAEYLYADFGRTRSSNLDGDVFSHKNSVHLLRVGFNYLFRPADSAVVAKY